MYDSGSNPFTCSNDLIFFVCVGRQPHKHKIVIAGNHDMYLDDDYITHVEGRRGAEKRYDHMMKKYKVEHPKDLLTNCVYLLDETVEVAGIKIFGAPW